MRPWWAWVLVFAAGVGVGLIAKTPAGCRAHAYPVQQHRAERAAEEIAERRENAQVAPSFQASYLLAVALIREREARLLAETQFEQGVAPIGTQPGDDELIAVLRTLDSQARGAKELRICGRLKNWLTE